MNASLIKEDFLYFLWQSKNLSLHPLKTTDGQTLQIINPGFRNQNSGPDFYGSKVQIGDLVWAGNIEMHVFSSDWLKHRHQKDDAYQNVILHVVWIHDQSIKINQHNQDIPTIEIAPYVSKTVLHQYFLLQKSRTLLPCTSLWKKEFSDTLQFALSGYAIHRLEQKVSIFTHLLKENKDDWNYAFYCQMIKYFGGTINKEPFERLSQLIPFTLFAKNAFDPIRIEALLFGVAGLLNEDVQDEYYQALQKEYSIQKVKYELSEVYTHEWKYGKMLPAGFPTVRIAQLAVLVQKYQDFADRLLEADNAESIYDLFKITPNPYWETHYVFGKTVKTKNSGFTREFIDRIIINAVVPFYFAYGVMRNENHLKDKAIDLLDGLEAEKNAIVNIYKKHGIHPNQATDTQGLIHLYTHLCKEKRCTECVVGHKILLQQ